MITKLYELSGAAMVFGKERTITWKREGGLMIEALSHDEVMKILAAVAGPTQPGVPEVEIDWNAIRKQSNVARPVPSFEESDSAEPPFDGGKPIDTSFPPVDALAPVPVKASKIEASDRPGELPLSGGPKSLPAKDVSAPALQTAENLATVLTFLKNKGFTEWKTMFDECVRIRADVPLLAKVKDDDFKDRLLRVMATKLQMAVPDDA